jgi:ATP-dependent helicase HepA
MSRFVVVHGDSEAARFGIGKLESLSGRTARISFFDGPTTDPVVVEVPRADVELAALPEQTRAYWQDPRSDAWRVGRVAADAEERILVRFPNREDQLLSVDDLNVRWRKPIDDPTSYLAQWINETPIFADGRSGFVRAIIGQRAACQGMSALFSSVIELEPHQIEVVRRVLQDPVQRYLLADEVGLGKTIEAGILVRQYVHDDPNHRVVILVPPPLAFQWRDELCRRFLLGAELDASLLVISSDDVDEFSAAVQGAGMLVVDEAHHLTRNRALYEAVRLAALCVPRLLLLSATPVLRNELGYLEILHLLDPLVFPLEDADRFRLRIAKRQVLAETVAGLVADNVLQLDGFIDDLVGAFPDDELLSEHAATLRTLLDRFPEPTDPELLAALISLRAHLSETCRLDRRILRNRRRSVGGLTPDRAGVSFLDVSTRSTGRVFDAIEAWRSLAALSIYGVEESAAARELTELAAAMLAAAQEDPGALAELAECRATNLANGGIEASNRAAEERDALLAVGAAAREMARGEAVAEALSAMIAADRSDTKYVVFCSHPGLADGLAIDIAGQLSAPVDRHVIDRVRPDGQKDWRNFFDSRAHRILVCDRSAEEGLNLQGGGKVLVHVDLPLDPNRVEQRLGRLDRYGSGDKIRSIVIRYPDVPFRAAWAELLAEGLGVFDRSIASLQYLIDDLMRELRACLLVEGAEAVQSLNERLSGPNGFVAREFRQIDEMDALDALAEPSQESLESLFEADDEWRDFQGHVEKWLLGTLLMDRVAGEDAVRSMPGQEVFRFAFDRSRTLIPLDTFVTAFQGVLDGSAPGGSSRRPLTFPYTYRRQTAAGRRGMNLGVRILRVGEPLIDALTAMTASDDRGRTLAMWRYIPGYRAADIADVFFRFDFVVEADVAAAVAEYVDAVRASREAAHAALTRRGDMLFPPLFQRVWLDAGLNPVVEAQTLRLLEVPYTRKSAGGAFDANLNPQRWQLVRRLRLPLLERWAELIHRARGEAEAELRRSAELSARSAEAVATARGLDATRFAHLRARAKSEDREQAAAEERLLSVEQATAETLYAGIQAPRITLDTIGAVFLAGKALPRTPDND